MGDVVDPVTRPNKNHHGQWQDIREQRPLSRGCDAARAELRQLGDGKHHGVKSYQAVVVGTNRVAGNNPLVVGVEF